MAKKNKVSQYFKHSVIYYVLEMGRWISVITPFFLVYLQNKDKWIYTLDNQPSQITKMRIGMIILIGVLGWVVLREINKKKGRSYAPSVISGIIWWGIAFAVTYCFKTIINDLSTIILYGLFGQVAGAIFEMLAQAQHERRKLYQQAEINAKTFVREQNVRSIPYE